MKIHARRIAGHINVIAISDTRDGRTIGAELLLPALRPSRSRRAFVRDSLETELRHFAREANTELV